MVYVLDKKESVAPNTPAVENNLLHPTDSKITIAEAFQFINR